MKSIQLLVVLFLMTTGLYAQQVDVKINPIGALFSSYKVSAEYEIRDFLGIEGVARYSSNISPEGFAAIGSLKYYFNPEKGIDKWNAGIYTKFSRIENDTFDGKSRSVNAIGFMLGYKLISRHNLIFEGYAGAGRNINANNNVEEIDLTATINIGYRFVNNKPVKTPNAID